ncbi:MAG: hypothetical protein JWR00_18 [Rubritepida sp.]|jgi:hypothetical protein|nr:hypothetical protein [Rubritepida sp.]
MAPVPADPGAESRFYVLGDAYDGDDGHAR